MYLVIGPGGMAAFAYLGALSAIGLDSVEEVAGSSAGSIIAMLVCAGKTLDEIHEFMFGANLKELSKFSIVSFLKNYGLILHDPIKKLMRDFCGDLKFKDLKKKLYISCYCMNRMETEYFSVDNLPDMSVIDAVSMSMTVPFLFESCVYRGMTYIDGGTHEHVPSLVFLNKDPKDVVILKLEKHTVYTPEIKSIKAFIACLVNVVVHSSVSYKTLSREIVLHIEGVNIFDFSMSYEDKMKLYVQGYQTALIHLGSFK